MRFILSRLDFHSPLGKRPPISPMASLALPSAPFARRLPWLVAGALALLAAAAVLVAQVSGDRGIAPIASSTDIEVHGIKVDVSGKNAEDARLEGWRVAQREAWKKLGGPAMSDSQIEGLVSAIIVEQERLGPRRYIATLGVIFDRTRAGGILGGTGEQTRSAPMLTLPVLISGGAQTMFEVRNPWQRAVGRVPDGRQRDRLRPPLGFGLGIAAADIRPDRAAQPRLVDRHPRPVRRGRRADSDRQPQLFLSGWARSRVASPRAMAPTTAGSASSRCARATPSRCRRC
jgi:hypothetical protein